MDKRLQIMPDKCTGCRQCELACSWVQTGTFQPAHSLVRVCVFDEEASYAPYSCVQCAEAWCMNACPVNAIFVDDSNGAKCVDPGLCVGCHLCSLVCPFGTVFIHPNTETAVKCDLCGGQPACMAVCPTDAIELTESERSTTWFGDWSQRVQTARLAMLADVVEP